MASSRDGKSLFLVDYGYGSFGGYVYASYNSGVKWVEQVNAGSHTWISISCSSDGTTLVAADKSSGFGGYLYTSTDGGYVWKKQVNAGVHQWQSITTSSDGNLIAAVEFDNVEMTGGYIFTSSDGGKNWNLETQMGTRYWRSISSSGNGTNIASAVMEGYIYTATYCDCPMGTYALDIYQSLCEYCPAGYYNDIPGSLTCTKCSYPYTTLVENNSGCESLSVDSIETAIVLGIIFAVIFIVGLLSTGGKRRVVLCFCIMVIPALDVTLDVMYILSVHFVSQRTFDACIVVLVLSLTFQLFRSVLFRKRGTPFSYLHRRFLFPIKVSWVVLDYEWKLCNHKEDNSLERVQKGSLGLILGQIPHMFLYIFWWLVLAIPYAPWLLLGALLIQFKVLACGPVWNFWFYVYTGCHDHDIEEYIDVVLLNKSIQDQFIFGSSQQWIIQIHNTLEVGNISGEYTVIGVLSPAVSFLMVLNGIYRFFLYSIVYHGYGFDQVSFDLLKITSQARVREEKVRHGGDSVLNAPLDTTVSAMHIAISATTGELTVFDTKSHGLDQDKL